MRLLATHMTSGKSNGRALCGRRLRFVKWVEDIKAVDCDNCLLIDKFKAMRAH